MAAGLLLSTVFVADRAQAQVTNCVVNCQPVARTDANLAVSAGFAQFDLGSQFLKFLGDQGSVNWQGAPNPGGGGADMPATPAATPATPVWRVWGEGYGLRTRMDAKGDFVGDTRKSVGGVVGIGRMLAPGAMIGLSVDQSRTKIDVTGLPQHATLDLTQVGLNGVYETGPWTFAGAAVTGFGKIDSTRDTATGTATAGYDAKLFGVVAEASYYHALGTSRIVPKLGLDFMRTQTDAFTETGGLDPAIVPSQVAKRARVYAGAEVGNTWVWEQRMLDLSAYGRAVDIYWREVPNLVLSSTNSFFTPQTIQGVAEARFGIDAGAMASYRFMRNARVYAGYDGRFRSGYQAHGGTVGLEVRW